MGICLPRGNDNGLQYRRHDNFGAGKFRRERSLPIQPRGESDNKKKTRHVIPPNARGLYDMHGNDAEYCLDSCFRRYTTEEVTDPLYLEGGAKVLRGGRMTAKRFLYGLPAVMAMRRVSAMLSGS